MAYELKTGWHGITTPETAEEDRRRRRQREARATGTSLSVNDLIEEFLDAAERGSALDRYGRRFSRDGVRELRWSLDDHLGEELGNAIEQRLIRGNPAERIALPDEDEARPQAKDITRRPTLDRAISLTLQLATLGFALITLILIAQSL